jgi:pimeloyl-ACP methyl ester carboxylesterase
VLPVAEIPTSLIINWSEQGDASQKMSDDTRAVDEFDLLQDEAAEFEVPWSGRPTVARTTVDAPDGDGPLSAIAWGADATELVLLHGGGLNAHTWDAFALANGRPALAIDLPGHGDSPWRDDGDYHPATIGHAITDAISEAAPDALAVVGQSLGGLTAIAVAQARPDLVRRLVIVDVTPGVFAAAPDPEDNQVRAFLAGPQVFDSRDDIVDRAREFGIGVSRASVERGVFHNTRQREDGKWVFKHHLANGGAMFSTDFTGLWEPLGALDVPVLLVRASRGFVTDGEVDELRRRLPDVQVVTLDSGHNVQEDEPVELAEVVESFLQRTPTIGG